MMACWRGGGVGVFSFDGLRWLIVLALVWGDCSECGGAGDELDAAAVEERCEDAGAGLGDAEVDDG